MEAMTVRDYRNNMAASFERADKGERVLIRRRNNLYALTSVRDEQPSMTPKLKKRIEAAEKACSEGRCVTCNTKKEIEAYIASL